ncbi:MAG: transcriptional regulator [Candidatus Parabeggiatoa sp. nov. 2]|nr:MAG: transcriptional regulator [Gammaproteobacteria bacterium]
MSELLEEARWRGVEDFLSVPHTEAEYDNAVVLLNELIDTVGDDETHPLAGLMETLGTLMEVYEKAHYPMPEVSGADVLAYLMEEHGLKPVDLVEELGKPDDVLEILNGLRDLNPQQILAISRRFHILQDVFL